MRREAPVLSNTRLPALFLYENSGRTAVGPELQFQRHTIADESADSQFSCPQRRQTHRRETTNNSEFLGDAVLGFLASDFLCRAHPGLTEGQLSKLKGFLVSSANLVKFSEQLNLGDSLHLGKGEEKTGGREKQALLVDAFEAILGAMYIDGGWTRCGGYCFCLLDPQIKDVGDPARQVADFKTALQERLQARRSQRAEYLVSSETGPDHQKLFVVDVAVGGQPIASGLGLTRKAAEQAAAREALEKLSREAESISTL